MRKKLSKTNSKWFLASLCGLVILLATLVVSVSASQQTQNIFSWGKEDWVCRRIPAGTYNVKIKTYSEIPWEVTCPWKNGHWSGKIPAGEFPVGSQYTPQIYSGSEYSANTTLEKICNNSIYASGDWREICRVCKYIKCSKAKISGWLKVGQIQCSLGAYKASGAGKVELKYQDNLLGACSAKATYNGKVTGTFMVTSRPD